MVDEFLFVKVVLTAGLIFSVGAAITLMGYDLSGKLDRIAEKPIGRSRRELEQTVAALPWIIAMGAIVWLVWGARLFDNAIIDALQKYHS